MIVRFEDVITRVTGNVDRYNTDLAYYVGGDQYDSSALTIERRGNLKKDVDILGFKFHFPFKSGDVLLMARNPHLRKAGQVFFDGLCSDASYILRTKNPEVLLQDYIPILLQRDHFWDFFESHKTGGITFLMNWGMLKTYEFDLPPIEKQREVMEKVWAAYRLKQSYQKLIEATDEMVKSRFIEQFSKYGQSRKLGDVVKLMDDRRKPINDAERQSMKTGELYPYYGATGQVDSINSYLTDDTLLCIAEDCGNYKGGEESSYIITGKAWVNNHAHLVKPNEDCDITFLHYYLTISDLSPYVTGTTRQKLTQKSLVSIPVVTPPVEEQKAFVSIVLQADKSKFELKQAIEKIDKVMRALMQ